jgi:hypothetical protein
MSRFAKVLMTGILGLAIMAPIASARPPVVVFGGGFYGPAYYGPAYGWYGPGWGPYGYYTPAPAVGSVKVDTKAKDSAVYVDNGYAGTVAQLKTFHLRPGAHDIELRTPNGQTFYQEHVTIVAGKTLTIHPSPAS